MGLYRMQWPRRFRQQAASFREWFEQTTDTSKKKGIARWWFSITLENGYVNIYYMHTICIYILNISSAMLLPPQHWNFHKDQWRAGHPAGPTSLPSWFVILGAMPQDLWFQRGFKQPWTHHLMRNSHPHHLRDSQLAYLSPLVSPIKNDQSLG